MAGQEQVMALAAVIEGLRAELAEAVEQGRGQGMRFRVEPVEVTLQAVVTKKADGRVGWGALGVGAAYDNATTQTIRLRLQPLWEQDDGTLVEDFTVADQQITAQRFGPRPDAAD